ncbi:protein distal antenna isoform X2 [Eurosta solidaginis]
MNIRMSTKGKRPLRSLTPGDKIHAIQRIHDGESKASVARDIGVPESTLRGWCKNEDKLRFMSRQTEKMAGDSLGDKLGSSTIMMGGPPEKRQKVDNVSIPFNYSNKSKYEEMVYKQCQRDNLAYNSNKGIPELGFNGLSSDYVPYGGPVKNEIFAGNISYEADQTGVTISPLTNLTHLTGLSGLTQSPLGISFNELSSNLNLLAQINPGLAAMSGLNGLGATVSTLRSVKTKSQPLSNSPRIDGGDGQHGLSVKNWAKQKPASLALPGLNLCQTEDNSKNKIKCPSPSLGKSTSPLQIPPDDSLLYWLKSQQTILGLSNVYPPATSIRPSSPLMPSTPKRMDTLRINSTLNVCTPRTSSTPTFGFDDKNTAWLYWCKALGVSLNSLVPAAAAVLQSSPMQVQQPSTPNGATTVNIEASISTSDISAQKSHMENILFTQLTKNIECSSTDNSFVTSNNHCKASDGVHSLNRPEDLSAKKLKSVSELPSAASPPPNRSMPPSPDTDIKFVPMSSHSPRELFMTSTSNSPTHGEAMASTVNSMVGCKNVLDNLLYKIISSPSAGPLNQTASSINFEGTDEHEFSGESNASYTSDSHHKSCNESERDKRGNKMSEENFKLAEQNTDERDSQAIKCGEKFLKWLENCRNPRITATHLMQLRFLLSSLRPNTSSKDKCCTENGSAEGCTEHLLDLEDNNHSNKARRRK